MDNLELIKLVEEKAIELNINFSEIEIVKKSEKGDIELKIIENAEQTEKFLQYFKELNKQK